MSLVFQRSCAKWLWVEHIWGLMLGCLILSIIAPPPSIWIPKCMYNRHLKLSHLAWLKEFLSFFLCFFGNLHVFFSAKYMLVSYPPPLFVWSPRSSLKWTVGLLCLPPSLWTLSLFKKDNSCALFTAGGGR